jgi:hypothetical protein
MRTITRDELRHAALAWDLAEWMASRLTAKHCVQVDEERTLAILELDQQLQMGRAEAWARMLGLPTPREAQTMFRGLREEVWAA